MGTMYKAKIRYEVPMLFCMAVYFNFLIGGISGVFLSDVPVNVTVATAVSSCSRTFTTRSWVDSSSFFLVCTSGYQDDRRTMNKKLGLWHF